MHQAWRCRRFPCLARGVPATRRSPAVLRASPSNDRPFVLEGGGALDEIVVAYETWGSLDDDAVQRHPHLSRMGRRQPRDWARRSGSCGAWLVEGMVGPGLPIDTERFFVVRPNTLGGCQGSTGPSSIEPSTGRPYGSRFPVVVPRHGPCPGGAHATPRHRPVVAVIGGSMGGMQVLEWGVTYPAGVRSLLPIAACAEATAQQIALGSVGRRAIRLDPKWRGGDYYDAAPGDGPHEGLAVAGSWRSRSAPTTSSPIDSAKIADLQDGFSMWQRFEVERYLHYHGDKLVRRFDANSYLAIGKAMDLQDIGRGRGGLERRWSGSGCRCARSASARTCSIRLTSRSRSGTCSSSTGGRGEYFEIDSDHGHDFFLIDLDQVGG